MTAARYASRRVIFATFRIERRDFPLKTAGAIQPICEMSPEALGSRAAVTAGGSSVWARALPRHAAAVVSEQWPVRGGCLPVQADGRTGTTTE